MAQRYSNLTHAVLREGSKLEKFEHWRITPSENVRKLITLNLLKALGISGCLTKTTKTCVSSSYIYTVEFDRS